MPRSLTGKEEWELDPATFKKGGVHKKCTPHGWRTLDQKTLSTCGGPFASVYRVSKDSPSPQNNCMKMLARADIQTGASLKPPVSVRENRGRDPGGEVGDPSPE